MSGYPFVPVFDEHGGHRWAEVFEDFGGTNALVGYMCQRCGDAAAAYVVICRPGEEYRFIGKYGIANVQASPHIDLRPGEAYEVDGRIAYMMHCRGD